MPHFLLRSGITHCKWPHSFLTFYQVNVKQCFSSPSSLPMGTILLTYSGFWVLVFSHLSIYFYSQVASSFYSLCVFGVPAEPPWLQMLRFIFTKNNCMPSCDCWRNRVPIFKMHTPMSHSYEFLDDGLSPYVVQHLASPPVDQSSTVSQPSLVSHSPSPLNRPTMGSHGPLATPILAASLLPSPLMPHSSPAAL